MAERGKEFISLGNRNRSKSPILKQDLSTSIQLEDQHKVNSSFQDSRIGYYQKGRVATSRPVDVQNIDRSQHSYYQPRLNALILQPQNPNLQPHRTTDSLQKYSQSPINARGASKTNVDMISPTRVIIQNQNIQNQQNLRFMDHPQQIIHIPLRPSMQTPNKQTQMTQAHQIPQTHQITQMPQPSNNQKESELMRKLKILQNRVGELHQEKQSLMAVYNQEKARLEKENGDLKHQLNQTSFHAAEDGNISEMLSQEIKKNLEHSDKIDQLSKTIEELRTSQSTTKQLLKKTEDENIKLKQENSQFKKQINELKDSFATSSHQIQETNKQIFTEYDKKMAKVVQEYEAKITALKNQALHSQQESKHHQQMIESIMNDKEKRILELQETNYDYEQKLKDKMKEWNEIGEELATVKLEKYKAQQENQVLKQKIVSIEKSSIQSVPTVPPKEPQCQKCKDFLKTIFKLNSQLNSSKK